MPYNTKTISMQFCFKVCIFALVMMSTLLFADDKKTRTLYYSLDPYSVAQYLAFYELYSCTPEGRQALSKAWQLLAGSGSPDSYLSNLSLSPSVLEGMVCLINKLPYEEIPTLSDGQLNVIDNLAQRLSNRTLKGFRAFTEEEVLSLSAEEIDLGRAILLSQMPEPSSQQKVRSYEAMLDLMALQILAKLPSHPTPEKIIGAINAFIFEELGFRFPPHSKYAQDIDLYTFLPSVLDSRHGVCLGVSILYLSIAQRLNLPLEIVTPPGHIYIRYRHGTKEINIETTARGVHIPSEDYLGIDTRKLQTRNRKEVVGLAHINHASLFLKEDKFKDALTCYEKALPYLPGDEQVIELMGYCCLFTGDLKKGHALLTEVADYLPDHAVSKTSLAKDYLLGCADIEAIKAIFLPVDESRTSILKKKEALNDAVVRCPLFREGWQSLGSAWLQLHRTKEALKALETCHRLDSNDASVEYYLAVIYGSRMDFSNAWKHLRMAEEIVASRDHAPKALKYLRRQLATINPE